MKYILKLFVVTLIILSVSVSVGYADGGCEYLYFEDDFESGLGNMLYANCTTEDTLVDNATYGKAAKLVPGTGSAYCCTNYNIISNKFESGELKRVRITTDVLFESKSAGNLRFVSSEQINSTKNGFYPMSFTQAGKFTTTYEFTETLKWLKYSLGNYSTNKWYRFETELDLEAQTFDFRINGDLITKDTAIVTDSKTAMTDLLGARVNINAGSAFVDNMELHIPHSMVFRENAIVPTFGDDTINIDAVAVGEEEAVLFATSYSNGALEDIVIVNADNLGDILFAQYQCDIEPGKEYRFFLFNSTSSITPLSPRWQYYSYLEEDYQKVIDNWKYFLLGGEPDMSKSYVKTRVNNINTKAAQYQKSMDRSPDANSLWGAEYVLSSDLGVEYGKIWDMARAYGTKGQSLYKNAALKADIIYALDWMYDNRYGQTQIDADKDETVATWRDIRIHNWWDWFVDAPTKLVNIMMVMSDELTDEQIEKYFSLYDYICSFMRTNLDIDAHVNSRAYARFGADVLMHNDMGVKALIDAYPVLFACAKSGTGMYEDYSYIKHNMIPYTGVYGTGALLDRIVKIMAITADTTFELPQKYIKTYTGWIFNAFEPLMIDCGIMSMVRGRGVDGSSEQSDGVSVIQSVLNMIDAVSAGDAYRLKMMIKRHLADKNIYSSLTLPQMAKLEQILSDTSLPDPEPYERTRIYYNMDRAVHHKADWSAGLALHSERTGNYECINYQNENGWYTSDGMLYLYTTSDQYDTSYFKYADPYKRPGTTVDSQERQLVSIASGLEYFSSKDFAGGAVIGDSYATVAMELESFHNDILKEVNDTGGGGAQPLHDCDLTAKKSWYLFDDEIVCLGSDITASADYDVYTTVENRKVTSNRLSVNGESVEYGTEGEIKEPVYAHIEGTGGYYFPHGGNLSYRQTTNNAKFFEMWLEHGKAPQGEGYAYAVLPNMTLEETAAYVKNPSFEILSNTSSLQAVRQNKLNMTGYTFWKAGSFGDVTVSAPCILMIRDAQDKMTVSLSDPTFKLDELVVTLDGEYELIGCDDKLSVAIADGKTTIAANLSKIDGASLEAVFEGEEAVEPPPPVEDIMQDYDRVLLYADHEDGKLGKGFEYQNVTTDNVKSGDTTVIGTDRGYYVDICSDGTAIDSIYRPAYGKTTSPIQATGVSMADLDKMQISLDICPVTAHNFNIRFYDKWSGTTTKGETLITVKKDGKLTFANTDITYEYTLKNWMEIDTFLDFTADTYSVYIDGELIAENVPLKALTECCESVGVTTGKTTEGTTLSMYVDNFRIAIPSKP